jgi:hypothetical protein
MVSAKQEATVAGRRRLTASERQEIADKRRAQKPQSIVRIEVAEWTDDAGDPIVREVQISDWGFIWEILTKRARDQGSR